MIEPRVAAMPNLRRLKIPLLQLLLTPPRIQMSQWRPQKTRELQQQHQHHCQVALLVLVVLVVVYMQHHLHLLQDMRADRRKPTNPPPPPPPAAPPTPSLHVDEEGEEDAVKSGSTEPPDLTQPFTDEEEVELAEWYRAILRSYKETVKKKRIMYQRAAAMEPPRTGIIACCHGNYSEKLSMWLRLVPVQLSRDQETRFLCDFFVFLLSWMIYVWARQFIPYCLSLP